MSVLIRGRFAFISILLLFCALGCSDGEKSPDGGREPMLDADGDAGISDQPGSDGDGGGCLDAYAGQVLITEIMLLPQAAPGEPGCFIELFNNGTEPLRMEGWLLHDGDGGQAGLELAENVTFEPQTFLVLAFELDPGQNGALQPDLEISSIRLDSSLLYILAGEVEVDRVDFGGPGWPRLAGASMNLDPAKFDFMLNDYPQNWCVATTAYGDGDLGTPGEANIECIPPVCGDGIEAYPEQCDDGNDGDDADGCRDDCTFSCSDPVLDCVEVEGDCRIAACRPSGPGQVCTTLTDDLDVPAAGNPCVEGQCADGVGSEFDREDGYPCDNQAGSSGDYCQEGGCIEPVCGDGIRGPEEQCDDNNAQSGDGCSSACELESCGDGKLDAGELCDDGQNGDDLDGCRDSCLYTCLFSDLDCTDTVGDCSGPVCQANTLGQICGLQLDLEDSPDDSDPCTIDGCDAQGNPVYTPAPDGTACDNQTGLQWDYCVNGECLDPVCGDLIQGPLEQCDDGADGDDLDGCMDSCQYTCFNPAVDCNDTQGDCHSPVCLPNSQGQVCDQTVDTGDVPDRDNPCIDGRCDATGVPSSTVEPDGTICNNQAGEPGDYCVNATCIDPVCGDDIKGPLEECDQGSDNSDETPNACRTDCRLAHCGDQVVDGGEECDDSNFDSCDGCLHNCRLHSNSCQDGYVCPPETCDDENDAAGDGCTPDCQKEPGVCPADMITIFADPELQVNADTCMDRYEASRPDATVSVMGADTSRAVSRAGVIPWYTNPVTYDHFLLFQAACQASGKRLCTKDEFMAACTGPDRNTYVFGNTFDREACNCVDTFCDDYCVENNILPEDCNTSSNCGYTYYCFHVEPTGSFDGCTNSLDSRDINGNVWEIVPTGPPTEDPRGFEVRGGAFNCGGPSLRLQCTFNAGWNALFAGFRCCRDL